MNEGMREYNCYLRAVITDELLIEAKSRDEAAEIALDLFFESITGDQAINLIAESMEIKEVEEAV